MVSSNAVSMMCGTTFTHFWFAIPAPMLRQKKRSINNTTLMATKVTWRCFRAMNDIKNVLSNRYFRLNVDRHQQLADVLAVDVLTTSFGKNLIHVQLVRVVLAPE